jgi:hypothetical protein
MALIVIEYDKLLMRGQKGLNGETYDGHLRYSIEDRRANKIYSKLKKRMPLFFLFFFPPFF